jgi:ABC-type lipoprotein release transport system permease subunit
MFVSMAQNPPSRNVGVFIRTSSDDPLSMAGSIRAAVGRVERNAPVFGIAPLEQQLGTYLTQRRFQTTLLAGFSMVALLMAAVGIYGLIQYSIATRTQEIGLRMAIGAQSGDIFRMIVGEGLKLSLIGVALGLMGALWLGRAGASLLFGVTASDPLTFTTVSLLLTLVAVTACYFPARHAGGPESGAAGDVNTPGLRCPMPPPSNPKPSTLSRCRTQGWLLTITLVDREGHHGRARRD